MYYPHNNSQLLPLLLHHIKLEILNNLRTLIILLLSSYCLGLSILNNRIFTFEKLIIFFICDLFLEFITSYRLFFNNRLRSIILKFDEFLYHIEDKWFDLLWNYNWIVLILYQISINKLQIIIQQSLIYFNLSFLFGVLIDNYFDSLWRFHQGLNKNIII